MKAQKVYDLLVKLDDSRMFEKDFVTRMLEFIYQDVYYNTITLRKNEFIKNSASFPLCFDVKLRELEDGLSVFLDGNESILTYLDEMIVDDKLKFIKPFKNIVQKYFEILDKGLYKLDDFKPMSLTFNIYCMLKAYHEYKNDYLTFLDIVNDCKRFVDCYFLYECKFYSNTYNFYLKEKKKFIDSLIEVRGYSCIPEVRRLFVDSFLRLGEKSSEYNNNSIYRDVFKKVDEIYSEYDVLKTENNKYDLGNVNEIIDCYFKIVKNGNINDICYCKCLLFGNRFKYINDNISLYITDKNKINDFIEKLSIIDYKYFDCLNSSINNSVDSFMKCMDIVFDSDTYYEVDKKMGILYNASVSREIVDFDEILKRLNDKSNKKVVNDREVVYKSSSINQSIKPKSILDRMIGAYSFIYPGVDIKSIITDLNSDRFLSLAYFDFELINKINDYIALNVENEVSIREEVNDFSIQHDNKENGLVDVDNSSNGVVKEKKRGFWSLRG